MDLLCSPWPCVDPPHPHLQIQLVLLVPVDDREEGPDSALPGVTPLYRAGSVVSDAGHQRGLADLSLTADPAGPDALVT